MSEFQYYQIFLQEFWVMSSHRYLLIAICLIAVTMLLLATTQIVTSIILGYSGFSDINGDNDLIVLPESCSSDYYKNKYLSLGLTSQKSSFIASLVAFVSIIVAVFLLICFIHGCKEARQRRRDQTRVQPQQASFLFEESMFDSHDSLSCQIVALYIVLALAIITSSVQLNRYFQVYAQSRKGTCKPAINKDEILSFAIINSIICSLSVLCMILVLCLSHSYDQRMDKMESSGVSESYGHQIHRIIREIPNSERRFYDPEEVKPKQQESPKLNSRRSSSSQKRGQLQTEKIQQVESLIYQPDPSLLLNSAVQRPSATDL